MTRARRFWLGYAAAWLPVSLLYASSFALQGRATGRVAVLGALANVLPDALLGVAATLAARHAWHARRAPRQRATWILTLAMGFVGLATPAKAALNVALARLDGGTPDWRAYDRGLLLWHAFLSLLVFAVILSVDRALAASADLRAEEARRAEAELLRARAELKSLRAQLNPHFLFNALHTVLALVRTQPAVAERALEELGDLLRYSLRVQDAAEEGVLLSEEWEFVRAYLALQELRLGARLVVEREASPAALACVVPAFVLQPLVENAIQHGLDPRPRGGRLALHAHVAAGLLELRVEDDGVGAGGAATRGHGRGLELVQRRVAVLYGARAHLEVRSTPGAGFTVRLALPAEGPQ